uniref:Uncharacterized protein n=1 Tax=Fagus sylvatica TaxID=28930 RepID=A0A2N9J7C2_FAGSY
MALAQSALLSCTAPGGGGYGGFVVVMELSGFVAGGGGYGGFVVVRV